MTAQQQVFARMGLGRLRELAVQTHEHHTDEAARAFVERLIDLEIERRMVLLHERPGWHPASPGFGDGTGKSTVATDAMYLAYIKGIRLGEWHDVARRALSKVPERARPAALIKGVKDHGNGDGPLAARYDDIAKDCSAFAQRLGWPPGVAALRWYGNGQAIKWAANKARIELLLMAKAGVIQ